MPNVVIAKDIIEKKRNKKVEIRDTKNFCKETLERPR